MDTRNKILSGEVPWPEFARPLAVVTGYFDVLRTEHVHELEAARAGAATLLVVVLPRAAELLPIRARAELVAGLRAVDYVAVDGVAPQADRILHLDDEDDRRLRELRGLVKRKAGPPA